MSDIEDRIAARRKTLASDIDARIAARRAELSAAETPTPFADAFMRRIFDNTIGSAGEIAGDISSRGIAGTAAVAEGAGSVLTGGDFDFNRRANEQLQKNPAALLDSIGRFTFNESQASTAALAEEFPKNVRPIDQIGPDGRPIENPAPPLSERFGPAFDENLARINEEEARVAEKFQFKTGAGNVLGDVASIFTGRAPLLPIIGQAEKFLAGKKFAAAINNPSFVGELGNIAKGFLDSKGMRSLMRGAGRAGEAGLEAAVLEALKGDDPLRTAGYVAGGQAVGSALIKISQGLASGGPMKAGAKLSLAAASYFGLIQTLKSGIPGGGDPAEVLNSMLESFEHISLLMIAGGVATATGAGRIRPGDAAKYTRSAEFLSTLPRAATISMLTEYVNASPEEQQTIEATLEQITEDPNFFGPEITETLRSGIQDGTIVQKFREPL